MLRQKREKSGTGICHVMQGKESKTCPYYSVLRNLGNNKTMKEIKRYMMVATLALLWMGACAQPMMRPQGPLNEFSAIEGTSALQYNLPMERNIESRAGFGPVLPWKKLTHKKSIKW